MFLRRLTSTDQDGFLEAMRASRRLHEPWVDPPKDPEAFRAYLRRARRPSNSLVLACRLDDGAMVGVLDLSQIFFGTFSNAYLGYFGVQEQTGQGYMSEALHLTIRHAFGGLGLHRIEANIQPENARSIALVERAGFRREGLSPRYLKIRGRWRDHERWAILAEQWRAARRRQPDRPGRR